jgi:hypothetical protein
MRPPVLPAGAIDGLLRPPFETKGAGALVRSGGVLLATDGLVTDCRCLGCCCTAGCVFALDFGEWTFLGATGLGIGAMSACAVEFSGRTSTTPRPAHRQSPRISPQYGWIVSRQPARGELSNPNGNGDRDRQPGAGMRRQAGARRASRACRVTAAAYNAAEASAARNA